MKTFTDFRVLSASAPLMVRSAMKHLSFMILLATITADGEGAHETMFMLEVKRRDN